MLILGDLFGFGAEITIAIVRTNTHSKCPRAIQHEFLVCLFLYANVLTKIYHKKKVLNNDLYTIGT